MTDPTSKPPRHYFTEVARAAAAEAKRIKRENPAPKDLVEVFAVHLPATGKMFSWEIRRFGGLVVDRGVDQFITASEARVAGEAAKAAM